MFTGSRGLHAYLGKYSKKGEAGAKPKGVEENVMERSEVFWFVCMPVVHKMEKSYWFV